MLLVRFDTPWAALLPDAWGGLVGAGLLVAMMVQGNGGAGGPPRGEITALALAAYRRARRVVIFVVGVTLLVVGGAMIVLPGPAVVVIPLGLAVLAAEFAWARRWLRRLKGSAGKWGARLRKPDNDL